MKKLFKLKEWLTIPDTAKYLSVVFGEEVTETDVLQLALDGHLKLSIYLLSETFAERMVKVNIGNHYCSINYDTLCSGHKNPNYEDEVIEKIEHDINGKPLQTRYRKLKENCEAIKGSGEILQVIGIWDLPMTFNEADRVEEKYISLIGKPLVETASSRHIKYFEQDICITDSNETHFALRIRYSDSPYFEKNRIEEIKHFVSAGEFPKDSFFVIRTAALREFEQKIADEDNNSTKSVKESTVKTNKLLGTLAAIAIEEYGYDPKANKSPTPKEISEISSRYGHRIDPKTVRGWLKEGADLLEIKLDK